MMRIFLDTNVLLDWVLDREGAEDVGRLFERADAPDDKVRLYASFLSMANIAYIIRKESNEVILKIMKTLMHYVNVFDMTQSQLRRLESCESPDIEDRMQILCAESGFISLIITRNVSHFKAYTDIPVMTPKDLF